jgi:hypothetical protein
MTSLEKTTISMTIFTILLIAYGVGLGGIPAQTSASNLLNFNDISRALNPVLSKQCGSDIVCATFQIGLVLELPAILFFSVINHISLFLTTITGVIFGPEAGIQSVPFLDIFFIGAIVLPALYEVFRMFRGNASGGTL